MACRLPLAALLLGVAPLAAEEPTDPAAKRAVKGGQMYLKNAYRNGLNPAAGVGPGAVTPFIPPQFADMLGAATIQGPAWLAGLALIESGVKPDDPVVAQLARAAREHVMGATSTYQLSLLVMFLDRVGLSADEPLIQFATLRLMSGQCADGSWSYRCVGLPLDPVEQKKLFGELTRGARMTTPAGPKKKDEPPAAEEKAKGLHPGLEKAEKAVKDMVPGSGAAEEGLTSAGPIGIPAASGDHSNTQFATVALWVGRRHGVDVSDALARLDKHYRQNQAQTGGWGYKGAFDGGTPAMTCAGLMGIAMGFGSKEKGGQIDADVISKDESFQGGTKFLGRFLTDAVAQARGPRPDGIVGSDLAHDMYFMWSLERVGMVYGLDTIGDVDWYEWGSKELVRNQNRDGSWPFDLHSMSPENSTSFALLFLCRANLAKDFSSKLKGQVKDPGKSRLKSPGRIADGPKESGTAVPPPKTDPGHAKMDTPPAATRTSPQAKALADALVAATGPERDDLLAKYRDAKGAEYSDALLNAIGRLSGEAKSQARDALVHRLTRMTAATLNSYMREDPDPELRRAAALAAGAKGKERLGEFADSLIQLTRDHNGTVAQAARASLKALTGQDFGPDATSGPEARADAAAKWKDWWGKNRPAAKP
jgi:hypothetical protein